MMRWWRILRFTDSFKGFQSLSACPELFKGWFQRFKYKRFMEVIELTAYSEAYVSELDALMHELAPSARATEERVRKVIANNDMHQYAIFDGERMVACATLCVCHTPEMVIGFVEAVVVTAACRGQHLGRKLMERLLTYAKGFGVQSVHLTSNPKRVAANGLYQALGFERYETNCYHLEL